MKYLEIGIKTKSETSELVADLLTELTGEGVCIYDKNDLSVPTWDYAEETAFNAYGEEVTVKGYAAQDKAGEVMERLKERIEEFRRMEADFGSLEVAVEITDDGIWRDVWKEYFHAAGIGRVVICPEWEDYEAGEGEVKVIIDPGLAFGTGEHETTSMVIELMQEEDVAGKCAADVGCGSGILTVTALKLGAEKVVATDIDKQAVEAAEKNCSLNGVKAKIMHTDLLPDERGDYDIILANLTADILIRLSESIGKKVRSSGKVILSGILDVKLSEVVGRYESIGFITEKVRKKGEWRAVVMRAGW